MIRTEPRRAIPRPSARLRWSLAALPLPAWPDGRFRLAVDESNWLRPGAATSPERMSCHVSPRSRQRPHRVERIGELPGPVPDQEPEPGRPPPRSISSFRVCCTVQAPSGCAGTPRI